MYGMNRYFADETIKKTDKIKSLKVKKSLVEEYYNCSGGTLKTVNKLISLLANDNAYM